MSSLVRDAGDLRGKPRMFLEEPIRELVLDLDDVILRREMVLEARLYRVDLDRGEVLPRWTLGDLRRLAFLARTDLELLQRYVGLPIDYDATIDTAAVVLTGRAFANVYRERAARLSLGVPEAIPQELLSEPEREVLARATHESDQSRRWGALSKALLFTEP